MICLAVLTAVMLSGCGGGGGSSSGNNNNNGGGNIPVTLGYGNTSANIMNTGHVAEASGWIYYSYHGGSFATGLYKV